MTVRKAERLLNLIAFLLETDRLITPQQIQDTVPGYAEQSWEAFKRMFERDKEALREVGIPLEVAPVAIHGEPEVPSYPASHGCVRITVPAMDRFYAKLVNGESVWIYA